MPIVYYCSWPGCDVEVKRSRSYCKTHGTPKQLGYERSPERAAFFRSKGWRIQRNIKLARNLVCERCNEQGATEVHHKVPWRERPDLGLAMDNLEALCSSCHGKETAREIHARRPRK